MRSAFDKLISWTGLLLAVLLLVAGGLLYWANSFIGDQVHDQLVMQDITMPEGEAIADLSQADQDALEPYAGSPLDTGPEAKAYADHYILAHMNAASDGRTYAEVSSEFVQLSDADKASPEGQALDRKWNGWLTHCLKWANRGFAGKRGETLVLPAQPNGPFRNIVLLGIGNAKALDRKGCELLGGPASKALAEIGAASATLSVDAHADLPLAQEEASAWLGNAALSDGDFVHRALPDRVDEGFAGGEVRIDGGAHHLRPASDLGHAGVRIARERVERRVQDPRDAALGVGAATWRFGRGLGVGGHQWTATCGVSASLGRNAFADGRMTSAARLAPAAIAAATR